MMYGIDVVSVQSGTIQSQTWNKPSGALDEFKDTDHGPMNFKTEAILQDAQKIAQPTEVFSRLIQKIIETPNPKNRLHHPQTALAPARHALAPPTLVRSNDVYEAFVG